MSPWEELEIEESQLDKKLIKRAYAKRLKVTRPDENPEAFQKLHKAYKYLLNLSDQKQAEDANKVLGDKGNVSQDIEAVSASNDAHKQNDAFLEEANSHKEIELPLAEQANYQPIGLNNEQQQQEINAEALQNKERELTSQVDALLASRLALNSKSSWAFLYDHSYIFDSEFNAMLSVSVFERVSEYNLVEFKKNESEERHIKPEIVKYLDDVFGWSNNRDWFEEQYDEKPYKAIFNLIDYHAHQKQQNIIGAEVVNDDLALSESVNKIAAIFITIAIALVLIILIMNA